MYTQNINNNSDTHHNHHIDTSLATDMHNSTPCKLPIRFEVSVLACINIMVAYLWICVNMNIHHYLFVCNDSEYIIIMMIMNMEVDTNIYLAIVEVERGQRNRRHQRDEACTLEHYTYKHIRTSTHTHTYIHVCICIFICIYIYGNIK